jgi:hypothetical protein
MSQEPWFLTDRSAGKPFFDELHARASFLPDNNGFSAENGGSIASANQLNGVQKPPIIGALARPRQETPP